MIVLDTHAWLWWVGAPERLSPAAAEAIDAADRVGVAAISAWEVAMLIARRRIALDRDVRDWVRQALAHPRAVELPLTAEVAVEAGSLGGREFPGDPADRMIYATARASAATLVTRDERLRRFDPALTVW